MVYMRSTKPLPGQGTRLFMAIPRPDGKAASDAIDAWIKSLNDKIRSVEGHYAGLWESYFFPDPDHNDADENPCELMDHVEWDFGRDPIHALMSAFTSCFTGKDLGSRLNGFNFGLYQYQATSAEYAVRKELQQQRLQKPA